MADTDNITGKCLCGAVRFSMTGAPDKVSVCHCDTCRRWNSAPTIAVHPDGPVTIEDEGAVTWFRSSDWAERGFCGKCGSSLFYRLVANGETVVSAGALDDQARYAGFEHQIFIDEKPDYYDFTDTAPRLTAAEAIALFTGGEEAAS